MSHYFEAKIRIQLDPDALEERRLLGLKDSAIIHDICDELKSDSMAYLTGLSEIEFYNCEIVMEEK